MSETCNIIDHYSIINDDDLICKICNKSYDTAKYSCSRINNHYTYNIMLCNVCNSVSSGIPCIYCNEYNCSECIRINMSKNGIYQTKCFTCNKTIPFILYSNHLDSSSNHYINALYLLEKSRIIRGRLSIKCPTCKYYLCKSGKIIYCVNCCKCICVYCIPMLFYKHRYHITDSMYNEIVESHPNFTSLYTKGEICRCKVCHSIIYPNSLKITAFQCQNKIFPLLSDIFQLEKCFDNPFDIIIDFIEAVTNILLYQKETFDNIVLVVKVATTLNLLKELVKIYNFRDIVSIYKKLQETRCLKRYATKLFKLSHCERYLKNFNYHYYMKKYSNSSVYLFKQRNNNRYLTISINKLMDIFYIYLTVYFINLDTAKNVFDFMYFKLRIRDSSVYNSILQNNYIYFPIDRCAYNIDSISTKQFNNKINYAVCISYCRLTGKNKCSKCNMSYKQHKLYRNAICYPKIL